MPLGEAIDASTGVDGAERALDVVADLELDGRLAGYRYLPATKADLLRRLGRAEESLAAYRQALALAGNATERDFLRRRITQLSEGRTDPES